MTTTFNINLNKTKTLLAGPWVGELGWELFCWQGYIRKLSREYGKTIIICRSGQEFLYEDFSNEIYNYNSPTTEADMWNGFVDANAFNLLIKNIKHDILLRPFNIGYGYDNEIVSILGENFKKQEFIKYTSNTINKHYDIIIHPRNKLVGNDRNWDKEKWQKLVDLLKNEYTIAEIGNNEAHKLNGVDDYRNISIRDTVSLLNRTKLVVGQSSGPLHLASLCGTPHFVWSAEYNRLRYLEHWNPHKTKVFFYSEKDWNPEVDYIYRCIIKNINEI